MFRGNGVGVRGDIGVTFVKNPLCARHIRVTARMCAACAWEEGADRHLATHRPCNSQLLWDSPREKV